MLSDIKQPSRVQCKVYSLQSSSAVCIYPQSSCYPTLASSSLEKQDPQVQARFNPTPAISSVGGVSPGRFVSEFGSVRVAVFRRVFLRIFAPSLCYSRPPPIFFRREVAAQVTQANFVPCHSSPVAYPRSQDEVVRNNSVSNRKPGSSMLWLHRFRSFYTPSDQFYKSYVCLVNGFAVFLYDWSFSYVV